MRRTSVVLLLLALFAPTAAATETHVFFVERTFDYEVEATVESSASRSFRFVIVQQNVTRVAFALEWSETHDATGFTDADRFRLEATAPDGRQLPAAEGASGRLALVEDVGPVPDRMVASSARLEARLAEAAREAGSGEWTARVTLVDAGNPPGTELDAANEATLRATVSYYEAVPMTSVTLGGPVVTTAATGWSLAALVLLGATLLMGALIAFRARGTRRVHHEGQSAAFEEPTTHVCGERVTSEE